MRLDKFLQAFGLIKRRAIANEACKRGLVQVNGQPAKPTRPVTAGDVVRIDLPRRLLAVRVLQQPPDRSSIARDLRGSFLETLEDVRRAPVDPLAPALDPDAEDDSIPS